jgi:serine/threonine-protein kinase
MLWGGSDASDPWIGKVIADRYRITRALGRGGMGQVFLAEQKVGAASRKVAIKALHPDLVSDPGIAARFNREAETVIRLSHPNTIVFHDFGRTDNGILYIVMEYIEGQSLARLIERGPIEPARVEHILSQICSSLHEAHEIGIIHRDLKPENVILSQRAAQEDFVKLLDFGIAKRTELDADSLKLTRAGVVLGTPPYMSPEQFAGQRLDRRSDVYSLGVLAYEMLTGVLPFSAKTPWEWATHHLSTIPPAIPEQVAGRTLTESSRRTIRRALAKDVNQRPATAMDFIDEFHGRPRRGDSPDSSLGQAAATGNSETCPNPSGSRRVDTTADTLVSVAIPLGKRRRRLYLVALFLGLVLLLGLVGLGIATELGGSLLDWMRIR